LGLVLPTRAPHSSRGCYRPFWTDGLLLPGAGPSPTLLISSLLLVPLCLSFGCSFDVSPRPCWLPLVRLMSSRSFVFGWILVNLGRGSLIVLSVPEPARPGVAALPRSLGFFLIGFPLSSLPVLLECPRRVALVGKGCGLLWERFPFFFFLSLWPGISSFLLMDRGCSLFLVADSRSYVMSELQPTNVVALYFLQRRLRHAMHSPPLRISFCP